MDTTTALYNIPSEINSYKVNSRHNNSSTAEAALTAEGYTIFGHCSVDNYIGPLQLLDDVIEQTIPLRHENSNNYRTNTTANNASISAVTVTAVDDNFTLNTEENISSITPLKLRLVDDAIQNTIPLHQKTAYLEAQIRCPHLIEQESNPATFLQFENFNIWAAAKRLVTYWEWRVIIFGDIYAYKPILNLQVQKESGNIDFINILHDGSMILLPGTDMYGNSIVFLDRSRFHLPYEEMNSLRLLRIFFYNWTLLIRVQQQKSNTTSTDGNVNKDIHSDKRAAQGLTGGGVIVVSVEYEVPRTWKHLIEFAKNVQSLMIDAFPVSLPIYHTVFLPNKIGWSTLIGMVVPFVASQLSNLFRRVFQNIIIHICKDEHTALNKLEQSGINDPDRLPKSVGGRWTYDNYDVWFQQQLVGSYHDMQEQHHQCYSQPYNPKAVNIHQNLGLHDCNSATIMSPTIECNELQENHQSALAALTNNNTNSLLLRSTTSSENESEISIDTNSSIVSAAAATTTTTAVYGNCTHRDNDNILSVRPLTLQLVDDAIENAIPLHEKTSYLEAKRRCPHLIAQESDPVIFLQYENYNIWAAAQRLVSYWEWRSKIFGDIYAYAPILNLKVQKEMGNIDFLDILQNGNMVLLPNTDSFGNSIVFIDRSRLHLPSEEMHCLQLLRIFFYTWTLLIRKKQQEPLISTEDNHNDKREAERVAGGSGDGGVIQISLEYDIPSTSKPFLEFVKNYQIILNEAFPISLPICHLVFLPCKTGWRNLKNKVVPFITSHIFKFISGGEVYVHTCKNELHAQNELEQHGLTNPNFLPISVGGKWSYDNFDNWFQQQVLHGSNVMLEQEHQNQELDSLESKRVVGMSPSVPARDLLGNHESGTTPLINNGIDYGSKAMRLPPTRNKRPAEELSEFLPGLMDNDCNNDCNSTYHSKESNSTSVKKRRQSASPSLNKKAGRLPLKSSTKVSSSETKVAIENLRLTISSNYAQTPTHQWAIIDYWKKRIAPPPSSPAAGELIEQRMK